MYVPKNDSKPRETFPDGTYTGILYSLIDLGSHRFLPTDKPKRKVRLGWELCDEVMSSGKPFVVSREYGWSYFEKAPLAKDILAWTGTMPGPDFNIETLLSRPCNLSIVHNEKGYPTVVAISSLKRSEKPKPQVNSNFVFDLEKFEPNNFEALPEFIRKKIAASPEYKRATGQEEPPPYVTEGPDDLPWDV
jgi:hypothetical protein